MAKLQLLVGNFLEPRVKDPTAWVVHGHVVNDVGAFGAGVALQIADRWPEARQNYLDWGFQGQSFQMGNNNCFVVPNRKIMIVHMLAQHGLPSRTNKQPLCYISLAKCLNKLGNTAQSLNGEIHMPKVGCGLARGDWNQVAPMILELIPDDVPVSVYILPEEYEKITGPMRPANCY